MKSREDRLQEKFTKLGDENQSVPLSMTRVSQTLDGTQTLLVTLPQHGNSISVTTSQFAHNKLKYRVFSVTKTFSTDLKANGTLIRSICDYVRKMKNENNIKYSKIIVDSNIIEIGPNSDSHTVQSVAKAMLHLGRELTDKTFNETHCNSFEVIVCPQRPPNVSFETNTSDHIVSEYEKYNFQLNKIYWLVLKEMEKEDKPFVRKFMSLVYADLTAVVYSKIFFFNTCHTRLGFKYFWAARDLINPSYAMHKSALYMFALASRGLLVEFVKRFRTAQAQKNDAVLDEKQLYHSYVQSTYYYGHQGYIRELNNDVHKYYKVNGEKTPLPDIMMIPPPTFDEDDEVMITEQIPGPSNGQGNAQLKRSKSGAYSGNPKVQKQKHAEELTIALKDKLRELNSSPTYLVPSKSPKILVPINSTSNSDDPQVPSSSVPVNNDDKMQREKGVQNVQTFSAQLENFSESLANFSKSVKDEREKLFSLINDIQIKDKEQNQDDIDNLKLKVKQTKEENNQMHEKIDSLNNIISLNGKELMDVQRQKDLVQEKLSAYQKMYKNEVDKNQKLTNSSPEKDSKIQELENETTLLRQKIQALSEENANLKQEKQTLSEINANLRQENVTLVPVRSDNNKLVENTKILETKLEEAKTRLIENAQILETKLVEEKNKYDKMEAEKVMEISQLLTKLKEVEAEISRLISENKQLQASKEERYDMLKQEFILQHPECDPSFEIKINFEEVARLNTTLKIQIDQQNDKIIELENNMRHTMEKIQKYDTIKTLLPMSYNIENIDIDELSEFRRKMQEDQRKTNQDLDFIQLLANTILEQEATNNHLLLAKMYLSTLFECQSLQEVLSVEKQESLRKAIQDLENLIFPGIENAGVTLVKKRRK